MAEKFSTREELIQELQLRASRDFSKQEVDDLVVETKSHIDCGIQERVALGTPAPDAEAEALEAFGNIRELLRHMMRKKERRVNKSACWIFLVGTLCLATAVTAAESQPWIPMGLLIASLITCGLLGVCGRRSGRMSWRGIGLGFLVAVPLVAVSLSITNTADQWNYPVEKASLQRNVQWAEHDLEQNAKDWATFNVLRSKALIDLQHRGAPFFIPQQTGRGGFLMKPYGAHSAAAKSLEVQTRQMTLYSKDTQASEIEWRDRSARELARPFLLNWLLLVPFSACFSAFALAVALFCNAIGVFLRVAVSNRLVNRDLRIGVTGG